MSGCYSSGGKPLSPEWERRVRIEVALEVLTCLAPAIGYAIGYAIFLLVMP